MGMTVSLDACAQGHEAPSEREEQRGESYVDGIRHHGVCSACGEWIRCDCEMLLVPRERASPMRIRARNRDASKRRCESVPTQRQEAWSSEERGRENRARAPRVVDQSPNEVGTDVHAEASNTVTT